MRNWLGYINHESYPTLIMLNIAIDYKLQIVLFTLPPLDSGAQPIFLEVAEAPELRGHPLILHHHTTTSNNALSIRPQTHY